MSTKEKQFKFFAGVKIHKGKDAIYNWGSNIWESRQEAIREARKMSDLHGGIPAVTEFLSVRPGAALRKKKKKME